MSKNTIFIEALGLVDNHFSGVGQYIYGLLSGIDKIIDEELKKHKVPPKVYILIPNDSIQKFNNFGFRHLKPKIFPLRRRVIGALWHRGLLPPIDLFFGRGYYVFTRFVNMPLLFSKSSVVIYDLSYELFREYSDEKNANFLSKRVAKTINKSDSVITISENAKKEISNFYKISEEDISVIHPAVDQKIFYRKSNKEILDAKSKYGIQGDYIISLSNLEPRKNLESLIDAYCSLDHKIREDLSLLLVGAEGWKVRDLSEKINNKITQGFKIIRPTKYVEDVDKPALISGAKMLVFPSHYEGFGIPPLEALSCGVPALVSNNSSLPEVVGNTGGLIKSTGSRDIKVAILSEINNPRDMSYEGPMRAHNFSWEKSARKLLKLNS